ncbi:MAG TPA: response regulator transcription factor [Acidimicrobiales bacterium]|nr:response regulator transcription factor [Acidimicrobiales bacterium]
MTIRVLLADDQTVVRVGFRAMLELTDDIVVVGEAANGRDAIDLARAARPDVVLMDVRMPVLDGLAATRAIAADPTLDDVRVVVLTTFEIDDYVFGALEAGASGFLLKDLDADELHAAVRTVAAGHSLLAPTVTRRVVDEFTRRSPRPVAPERLDVLTDREREVTRLVAHGFTNDAIARHLVMSPHTAKTHVNRAMTKLHARDRAQLVVVAYQTGLAGVGDAP